MDGMTSYLPENWARITEQLLRCFESDKMQAASKRFCIIPFTRQEKFNNLYILPWSQKSARFKIRI